MGRRTLFGELSLLFDTTRTATVIATEPTVVLVIPKEAFMHCMKKPLLLKINSLIEFYRLLPFAKGLPDRTLMMLACRSSISTLLQDTMVAVQGLRSKKVHFVRDGRLKVVREIQVYELLEATTVMNYQDMYASPD